MDLRISSQTSSKDSSSPSHSRHPAYSESSLTPTESHVTHADLLVDIGQRQSWGRFRSVLRRDGMAGVESAPSLSRKYQLVIDFVFTAEAEMPTFSDVGQIHLVANFEVDVSEA